MKAYAASFLFLLALSCGKGESNNTTATTSASIPTPVAQWAQTVSTGSGSSVFSAIAMDSSGNVYAVGYQSGTGTFTYGTGVTATGTSGGPNPILVKFNSNGTAQWVQTITAGTGNASFDALAVDGAGNLYAAGKQLGPGANTYSPGVTATPPSSVDGVLLVKYNSAGVAQWARTTTAGTSSSYFNSLVLDSSGNIYACGGQQNTTAVTYGAGVSAAGLYASGPNAVLVKYDSNGVAQWARTQTAGANYSQFDSVAVDSSGSVYVSGFQQNGGSYTYGPGISATGPYASGSNSVLVKYDSSGAAQWVQTLTGAANNSRFMALKLDSTGNIYVAGFQQNVGTYTYGAGISINGTSSSLNAVLVKYNSGGAAQWARTTSSGPTNSNFRFLALDNSGNIFTGGDQHGTTAYTYGTNVSATGVYASGSNSVLVKYNSAGSAQWAQAVTGGTNYSDFRSSAVDNSGNIYVVGSQANTGAFTYGTGVSATGSNSGANVILVKYREQ